MREAYLVCYDICDDKRLRQVFKICKNYGNHLQLSVFECDLSPTECVRFQRELLAVINQDIDQVLFVQLGPVESRGDRAIVALGTPYFRFDSPAYIV